MGETLSRVFDMLSHERTAVIAELPEAPIIARDRESNLLDFWRWAFSDLRMNNIRGVFAEWMVGKLLDLDPPPRNSWDSCDLRLPDGKGIEVKSAAYLQAWERVKPSRITFAGLRGRVWDPRIGYAKEQTCNAEVYVFCLQIEKDPEKWDAFNLDQWRFHVLPRRVIEERDFSRIGLEPLRKLTRELRAEELQSTVLEILEPGSAVPRPNQIPNSR